MKTVTCCGSERESKFCPDCGKQLFDPTPLTDLLLYCRRKAREHAKTARRQEEVVKLRAANPERCAAAQKAAAKYAALRDRWLLWADWLDRAADALGRAPESNGRAAPAKPSHEVSP